MPQEELTKLSIYEYARIMQINSLHIFGVQIEEIDQGCSPAWFRWNWQAAGRISREDVYTAIARAEADIEHVLNYRLLPTWEVDEWRPMPRPSNPRLFNLWNTDARGQALGTTARWGHFVSGGIRSKELVDGGAAVSYASTRPPATYENEATVTVGTVALDPGEICVYYPGKGGDDHWQIRPVQVSIAAGVATIHFQREQAVIEDREDAMIMGGEAPNNAALRPTEGTDAANFLTTVDVYRVYNDPQALRNGTPVLTPMGWRPIEQLRPGDSVTGKSGRPTRVTGVFPQGKRPLFRMAFDDGTTIDCDEHHRWAVDERQRGRSAVMTTRDLLDRGILTDSGMPRFHIPVVEPVEFGVIEPLPISPYTLGALIGDGHLSAGGYARISTQRAIVERAALPPNHSWRERFGRDYGNDVAVFDAVGDGRSNLVLTALRALGLEGKRAWEKFIPREYLWASVPARRELLRGLLDSDGKISKLGSARYFTTSSMLADDVAFLVRSLGGLVRTRLETLRPYPYKGEVRAGRPIYELTIRFAGGWCPFTLPEKAERWTASRRTPRRSIVTIEPIDVDDCTCIAVDAPDELYVTKDFLVTHNTQVSMLWDGSPGCGCDGESTCGVCGYGVQAGCITLQGDPRLSMLRFHAADWDADENEFTNAYLLNGRSPDIARLYYYAGLRDKTLATPNVTMAPDWARIVAIYATSLLTRDPCSCFKGTLDRWRFDMSDKTVERLPDRDMASPFGLTRGAINAWRAVARPGARVASHA